MKSLGNTNILKLRGNSLHLIVFGNTKMFIFSNYPKDFYYKDDFVCFYCKQYIDFDEMKRRTFRSNNHLFHYELIKFHGKEHKWYIFQSDDDKYLLYKIK